MAREANHNLAAHGLRPKDPTEEGYIHLENDERRIFFSIGRNITKNSLE